MTMLKERLENAVVRERLGGTDYVIEGREITIAWGLEPLFVIGEIGMTKTEAAELLGISKDDFVYDEELPFN